LAGSVGAPLYAVFPAGSKTITGSQLVNSLPRTSPALATNKLRSGDVAHRSRTSVWWTNSSEIVARLPGIRRIRAKPRRRSWRGSAVAEVVLEHPARRRPEEALGPNGVTMPRGSGTRAACVTGGRRCAPRLELAARMPGGARHGRRAGPLRISHSSCAPCSRRAPSKPSSTSVATLKHAVLPKMVRASGPAP
jgi:hypothetical protein